MKKNKDHGIKDISEAGLNNLLARKKDNRSKVIVSQSIVPEDRAYLESVLAYDEIINYTLTASFTGSVDISYRNQNYKEAPECVGFVTFNDGTESVSYKLPYYQTEDAGFIPNFIFIFKYIRILPGLRSVSLQIDSEYDPPSAWTFTVYVLRDKTPNAQRI